MHFGCNSAQLHPTPVPIPTLIINMAHKEMAWTQLHMANQIYICIYVNFYMGRAYVQKTSKSVLGWSPMDIQKRFCHDYVFLGSLDNSFSIFHLTYVFFACHLAFLSASLPLSLPRGERGCQDWTCPVNHRGALVAKLGKLQQPLPYGHVLGEPRTTKIHQLGVDPRKQTDWSSFHH